MPAVHQVARRRTEIDDVANRASGVVEPLEQQHDHADVPGQGIRAQRHLGDDAERPLRAAQQSGQIEMIVVEHVENLVAAAVCGFASMDGAVQTVITTMQLGIPVARIELLDETQIDAVNRYSKLSYALKPTLLFEFHGTSQEAVREHATTVQEIAAENGGADFAWATTTEDRARLWQARHNTFYACLALRPGAKAWVTDVCVPISTLAACVLETRRDIQESGLTAPMVGHAGDGNFHLVILLDPSNVEELAHVRSFNSRLVRRAIALGGTSTGEHGIGMGKIDYLPEEHGSDAVEVMRAIKQALDPANRMNPGKIFR